VDLIQKELKDNPPPKINNLKEKVNKNEFRIKINEYDIKNLKQN
jgi:hypothetical protein